MSATLTWAIKDGKYVPVSMFEPGVGLGCGCICPECQDQLGSRIYSKRSNRESCFFHSSEGSTCTGGQAETELHLLAKEIFEMNNWLMNPPFRSAGNLKFAYKKVEFECLMGNIRPDIVLTNENGAKILVEIGVTSFINGNKNKIINIEKLGLPTVEIDLKDFYIANPVIDNSIKSELQHLLIVRVDKKKWIWNTPDSVGDSFEEKPMNYKPYDFLVEVISGIGLIALFVFLRRKKSFKNRKRRRKRK